MVVAPFVYSNTITTAVTRLKSLVIITRLFYLVVTTVVTIVVIITKLFEPSCLPVVMVLL